jgi:hypothetical protein
VQVKGVENPVVLQILDDSAFNMRIVMPVVDNARTGQKVDEAPALLIEQHDTARPREHTVEGAAVKANSRFEYREFLRIPGASVSDPDYPAHYPTAVRE